MARSTVDNGLDPLHIGLPGTIGTSVGVGNLDTEGNALATIITLRHSLHLQSVRKHVEMALLNKCLHIIAEFPEKSKCFLKKFLFPQNNIDIPGLGRYNGGSLQEWGRKYGNLQCTPYQIGKGI